MAPAGSRSRRKHLPHAAVALLLGAATSVPARADVTVGARAAVTVDTATFPTHFQADGQTLTLNGVGTRVVFLVVRAYATGLYLVRPAHTLDAVLASPGPKAILTDFLHDASAAQMRGESDTLHRRYCAVQACPAADQAAYDAFVASFRPVHAGETQLIVVTDAGVDISRDGASVAHIPNRLFGQNLLRSLLGPSAPTRRYRNGLLGVTD